MQHRSRQQINIWLLGILLIATGFYGYAQNLAPIKHYTYTLAEATTIDGLLQELSKKFQIDFAYSTQDMQAKTIQPGHWQAYSLQGLLTSILEPRQVSYWLSESQQIICRSFNPELDDPRARNIFVEGRITDADSYSALPQVAVYVEETQEGVFTDERGIFGMNVPANAKDASLRFRLLGYEPVMMPVSSFLARKKKELKLKPKPFSVEIIDIKDRQAPPSLDAIANLPSNWLRAARASNVAGKDMMRSVQLLPGINASNDASSEIEIRGSSGDETLVILDEIPIYKADHYFGIFSAISPDYVEQVELYKNVFPVGYGGKTGGMLKMESLKEIDNFETRINTNLLTSSLQFQVPLGNQWNFILQGRTTNGNGANSKLFEFAGKDRTPKEIQDSILSREPLIIPETDMRFYDMNAKLNWNGENGQSLSLNFFRSRDKFTNTFETNYKNKDFARNRFFNTEVYLDSQVWSNLGASMTYQHLINDRLRARVTGYYTQYEDLGSLKSGLERTIIRFDTTIFRGFQNMQESSVKDIGFQSEVSFYPKETQAFTLGLGGIQHQSDFLFEQADNTVLDGQLEAAEFHVYANYDLEWNGLNLSLGNRVNYYSLTDKIYLSPRLHANYEVGEAFSLKAAFGINQQFVREIEHENQLGQSISIMALANDDPIPVSEATNYMLGANFKKGNWVFDIEGYFRDLQGVTTHRRIRPGFSQDNITAPSGRDYDFFIGTGKIIGLDTYLGYESKNYTGWLAYTLSKATHSYREIFHGENLFAPDDRRHQLKWVNNFNWNRWNFSANFIFSTGTPFTDISQLPESRREWSELSPMDIQDRLRDYLRIDLGASYDFPIGKSEGTIGLSVFNLADRLNINHRQYIYALSVENDRNSLGRNWEIVGIKSGLLDRTINLSLELKLR